MKKIKSKFRVGDTVTPVTTQDVTQISHCFDMGDKLKVIKISRDSEEFKGIPLLEVVGDWHGTVVRQTLHPKDVKGIDRNEDLVIELKKALVGLKKILTTLESRG